jgi:RNA polymerase sigma-70 factor (ECF subfamily)
MAAGEMDQDQRVAFEARLVALRPALHRYAARMVGSALDGEDVVQEAIARAVAALDRAPPDANAEGWLFRIAHNAAMDFLRARARWRSRMIEEDDLISAADEAATRVATRAALSVFMQLPPAQRGTVILKDVLGYSNEESARILGTTLAATKAALHRGRNRLRLLADAPAVAPQLDPADLDRLRIYVDRFNARDFDAIRAMIADDVRFDLVAQVQGGRSSFETYFSRYGEMVAWHLAVGLIDGRLAAVVTDPADPAGTATHVIAIDWIGGRISRLRDFYHARYVLDGAAITLLA